MDTIFAEATAPGKAGVAIIRISGPAAFDACKSLAGVVPPARQTTLRHLRSANGEVLDHALILAFDAGASFTGEDVVEFQLHGSRAVVAAVQNELALLPDLRVAQPGEFTRRALENDRLDLTQVEGLADLIEAETDFQRRQANRVLSGEFSRKILIWRDKLIHAGALIEATLDFADEDVPVDVMPDVKRLLYEVQLDLQTEIDGFVMADRIRFGFEVAILGPPNAGKSTLLNSIARRDVALTSSIAGTTRDVIEVRTDLDGLPVTFLDTAGLRQTDDLLETAGIERAVQRANSADLRVFLSADRRTAFTRSDADDIWLEGKSDLGAGDVSGLTGEGVDELISRIGDVLHGRLSPGSVATRERHVNAMRETREFLSECESRIDHNDDAELIAYHLRSGIRALESVVGRVDVDDILGDIFSRFCIGK